MQGIEFLKKNSKLILGNFLNPLGDFTSRTWSKRIGETSFHTTGTNAYSSLEILNVITIIWIEQNELQALMILWNFIKTCQGPLLIKSKVKLNQRAYLISRVTITMKCSTKPSLEGKNRKTTLTMRNTNSGKILLLLKFEDSPSVESSTETKKLNDLKTIDLTTLVLFKRCYFKNNLFASSIDRRLRESSTNTSNSKSLFLLQLNTITLIMTECFQNLIWENDNYWKNDFTMSLVSLGEVGKVWILIDCFFSKNQDFGGEIGGQISSIILLSLIWGKYSLSCFHWAYVSSADL